MPLDPTAARVEREFRHASPLLGCRFDPSGRFLFASSQDNTILRFDLVTGGRTALVGHTSWGRGMAELPQDARQAGSRELARALRPSGRRDPN